MTMPFSTAPLAPWRDALLEFVLPNLSSYKNELLRLAALGRRSFVLHPDGDPVLRGAVAAFLESSLGVDALVQDNARSDAINVHFETNAEACSSLLMGYMDRPAAVVAPRTAHHFSKRPIFCVSIPKAGFHLVARILSDMGFTHRGRLIEEPDPQCAYFYLRDHSHLTCNDLFTELAHTTYGGADSAIFQHPIVFCYRHPADIVISEAGYYAEDQATALASYFAHLPFDERLSQLISDDGMVGTLRDRVASYKEWMELPNVLPIAFEEIVGESGGGSASLQLATVWSMQLKLHVPGQPREFVRHLFGDSNQTFRKGQIGGFRSIFKPEHYAAMASLDNTDFLERFGYDLNLHDPEAHMPKRSAALRQRPLGFHGSKSSGRAAHEQAIVLAEDTLYRWHGYHVGMVRSRYCAIEPGQPRFDPFRDETEASYFVASRPETLEKLLLAKPLADEPLPVVITTPAFRDVFRTRLNVQPLFSDVIGYSIVRVGEQVVGIPPEIGELSGHEEDLSLIEGLIIGSNEDEVIARIRSVTGRPWLVAENHCDHNIVEYHGMYYGIAMDMGDVDLTREEVRALESIPRDTDLGVLKRRLEDAQTKTLNNGLPHLICEGYHGFNLIYCKGMFFAVLQSAGEFDLLAASSEQTADLLSAPTRHGIEAAVLKRVQANVTSTDACIEIELRLAEVLEKIEALRASGTTDVSDVRRELHDLRHQLATAGQQAAALEKAFDASQAAMDSTSSELRGQLLDLLRQIETVNGQLLAIADSIATGRAELGQKLAEQQSQIHVLESNWAVRLARLLARSRGG